MVVERRRHLQRCVARCGSSVRARELAHPLCRAVTTESWAASNELHNVMIVDFAIGEESCGPNARDALAEVHDCIVVLDKAVQDHRGIGRAWDLTPVVSAIVLDLISRDVLPSCVDASLKELKAMKGDVSLWFRYREVLVEYCHRRRCPERVNDQKVVYEVTLPHHASLNQCQGVAHHVREHDDVRLLIDGAGIVGHRLRKLVDLRLLCCHLEAAHMHVAD